MNEDQKQHALAEFIGLARVMAEVHLADGDCLGKIANRLFELTEADNAEHWAELVRKEYDC